MLSQETIKRLQKILEDRTDSCVSFDEAAEAADVYVGLFSVLCEKSSTHSNQDRYQKLNLEI